MVMEYCRGGSVETVIQRVRVGDVSLNISWALRLRWAKEIASALHEMHSKDIIHRDVKSANVLLDDEWHTKLCDYGLAVSSGSKARLDFSAGTDLYMAPEALLGEDGSCRKGRTRTSPIRSACRR